MVRVPGVTPTSDRSALIDALRGFALFGVCVSNLTWTAHWIATPAAARDAAFGARLNGVVDFLNAALVGHKFLSIFSMLFGVGFALMLRRIEERDQDASVFFLRRLGVLFLIGIVHLGLLWHGDILHIYALLGLALLALRGASDRRILSWAAMFIVVVPAVADAWETITVPAGMWGKVSFGTDTDSRHGAFTGGSYAAMLMENIKFYAHTMREEGLRLWTGILGRLLLGYWIGRRALLEKPAEHRRFWRTAAIAGSAAGLSVHVGARVVAWRTGVDIWRPGGPEWSIFLREALDVGHVALALGYMGLFVLFWERSGRRVLERLAPMGRAALTNYLLQTAIMIFLLYDIRVGLGLLGRLSLAADVAIALAVCLLQAAASGWWLRRYRFGPVEWVWRSLTYGRAQPMRKVAAAQG